MMRGNFKLFMLFLCSLFLMPAAAKAAWKLHPFTEVSAGYESNIHKSPDTVGTESGLEIGDEFLSFELGLKLNNNISAKDKLKLEYSFDGTDYISHSSLGEHAHNFDLIYRRKLDGGSKLKIKTDLEVASKRETDVLGDGTTRKYSYTKAVIGPEYEFSVGSDKNIELSYNLKSKDYEETSGLESLDYTQNEFECVFETGKKKSMFTLTAALWLKEYKEYTARDINGAQLAGNPKKELEYYTFSAEYGMQTASERPIETQISYRYRIRKDTFEDYYSYNEHRIRGEVTIPINILTEVEVDLSYKTREYKEQTTPTSGEKLTKDYIDLSVSLNREINKSSEAYLEYVLDNRDTNVTDNTQTANRDYEDHIITCGVKAEF